MNRDGLAQKTKIILAEHDPLIADILPKFLRPLGYEILIALDAQTTFTLVQQKLPDLVILDSDLPGMDGLALSQKLKDDFLTSYIPIIILIEKRQVRKRILEIKEGIDDFIIKPPDPIDLEVRIEMALRRTAHQVHANSLTRLPGNKVIELNLRRKIENRALYSFLYLDIDRFKSFNDTYGYLRGDGVIMQTARILTDCVKRVGNKEDFVGHVGGDDFVVITTPDKEEKVAHAIIREFDRLIPFHYNPRDRIAGFLSVKDRQGHAIKAPLMAISVAIVNNQHQEIKNILQLTEITSEIKSHLKTVTGSKFLVNRRNLTLARSKAERALDAKFRSEQSHQSEEDLLPLGQILLNSKLITEEQLSEALLEHWTSRQLLGQTLVHLGFVKQEDLSRFLPPRSLLPSK